MRYIYYLGSTFSQNHNERIVITNLIVNEKLDYLSILVHYVQTNHHYYNIFIFNIKSFFLNKHEINHSYIYI